MRVDVSIDGGQFQKADGLASWSILTQSFPDGIHSAVARATDSAGNSMYTATITFTVSPNPILKKTGLYIPLYMHPSGSNLAYYHAIANAKMVYPSVPIVAAINPAGGLGSAIDPYFTSAIG